MIATPSCYLCAASEAALQRKGVRHDTDLCVYRCQSCGLVFLWPQPDPAALAAYYEGNEYRAIYDPGVTLVKRYAEGLWEAYERVRRLRPYLSPQLTVCDVGAGCGSFLDVIRPHVGRVVGMEPEEAARTWMRERLGLQIVANADELSESEFDLITLFHVLEHMPDPVAELEYLAKYLAPGGRIVIEVPNVDDALITLYAVPAVVDFYYQKAHLFYFCASTLAIVLKRAGLAGTIEHVQRYDLSDHLRWMLTGLPGGAGYYAAVLGGGGSRCSLR